MILNTNQQQYQLRLLESFFGLCAVWSLNALMETLPPDKRYQKKQELLKSWEKTVKEDFQRQLAIYNDLLVSGKIENAEKAFQAEDFQREFNKIFGETYREVNKMIGL